MPRISLISSITLMAGLALSGCGSNGGGEAGNAVALKDLEVVDGTTSDAMTDLDGVKTEGTAMAPLPANGAASTRPQTDDDEDGGSNAAAPEEVVSDQ